MTVWVEMTERTGSGRRHTNTDKSYTPLKRKAFCIDLFDGLVYLPMNLCIYLNIYIYTYVQTFYLTFMHKQTSTHKYTQRHTNTHTFFMPAIVIILY